MLKRYGIENGKLVEREAACPANALQWADLESPTREEELEIEQCFGIEIPTREEMSEIEVSSRLYQEKNAFVLTTPLLVKANTDQPTTDAITFILLPHALITLRYSTPMAFTNFIARAERGSIPLGSSAQVFLGLLEAVIDRLADILEMIGRRIDITSHQVFTADNVKEKVAEHPDLRHSLREVARAGDLISQTRESLVGLTRLTTYVSQSEQLQSAKETENSIFLSIQSDLVSLSDHANFLSGKIGFLLDATLGMINIEQNGIIKIFSVAAVVFLPPTLVASIYGMNFQHMPELQWQYGYPMAVIMMILSAYLPFRWFKSKKWL